MRWQIARPMPVPVYSVAARWKFSKIGSALLGGRRSRCRRPIRPGCRRRGCALTMMCGRTPGATYFTALPIRLSSSWRIIAGVGPDPHVRAGRGSAGVSRPGGAARRALGERAEVDVLDAQRVVAGHGVAEQVVDEARACAARPPWMRAIMAPPSGGVDRPLEERLVERLGPAVHDRERVEQVVGDHAGEGGEVVAVLARPGSRRGS